MRAWAAVQRVHCIAKAWEQSTLDSRHGVRRRAKALRQPPCVPCSQAPAPGPLGEGGGNSAQAQSAGSGVTHFCSVVARECVELLQRGKRSSETACQCVDRLLAILARDRVSLRGYIEARGVSGEYIARRGEWAGA